MKKVLIIAFIYPPLGGSGVQRTLKFTKYLPENGWQPYVVCCDDPQVFNHGLDPSLMAEIPESGRIWRRAFVSPLRLRRGVQKALRVKRRAEIEPASETAARGEAGGQGPAASPGRRVLRALAGILGPVEFPPVDAALYWALAIVPGCLRLIREEKIEVIYSTSFPYSDHVAGYLVKKLSGKPWVADFRDPWTQGAGKRNHGWRYRVDQWVERKILGYADHILAATPTYTQGLRNLAPTRSADDFLTIENGYDPGDMGHEPGLPLDLAHSDHRIQLAHVGYVYDGTALPFLSALEALGELGQNIQVRFMGGLNSQEQGWLDDHRLAATVMVEPRQPHAQAVEAMVGADFVLLFVGAGQSWQGHYPGKLFEYMASGTPILLVGPTGDSADLVERSGTGVLLPADNLTVIVEKLRSLAEDPQRFRREHYRPRPEVIDGYRRQALTQRLALVFEQMEKAR